MKKAPYVALHLAALGTVVLQAMALVSRYFQPWLDADYLLPQRFAADVWGGVYPLSGWTLSSSPYLFPDFALSLAWHALLGGAPLLPYYVVKSYGALALLAGWSLQRVLQSSPNGAPDGPVRPGYGWIAGALIVNFILAWQGVADHARWLWWLGTATFHGGAVLLGLAQFALWTGPGEITPPRARTAVATVLLFLGLASDTLLLTQFVLPLGVALFVTAGAPRWRAPRVRAFLSAIIVACVLVALLRGALLLAGWWNFPNVVRHAPMPSAVAATAGRMISDLGGPVWSAVPGFLITGLVAAGIAAWWSARSHHTFALNLRQRQAGCFASLGLASTMALPVLAVYWHNPQHGRYLLPCLVLPLWWLATLIPWERLSRDWGGPWFPLEERSKLRPHLAPLLGGFIAAGLLVLGAWHARVVDFQTWRWPYPGRVAELDQVLAAEGRDRGLADFWHAHFLTELSRTGVRLNQLRPDGRVQFWGNNAFHHFSAGSPEAPLRVPRYSFILANGLDPAALKEKFGEPDRTVSVAGYELWLYDEPAAQHMSAKVDAEVRAFLGDRPGTERIAPP